MSDGRDFRETDPYLRNRYGINNSKFPGWLKFAIPTLLLALTWTIWSGANHSNPENKFDLIIIMGSLEHVFNPNIVLEKCRRASKSGLLRCYGRLHYNTQKIES